MQGCAHPWLVPIEIGASAAVARGDDVGLDRVIGEAEDRPARSKPRTKCFLTSPSWSAVAEARGFRLCDASDDACPKASVPAQAMDALAPGTSHFLGILRPGSALGRPRVLNVVTPKHTKETMAQSRWQLSFVLFLALAACAASNPGSPTAGKATGGVLSSGGAGAPAEPRPPVALWPLAATPGAWWRPEAPPARVETPRRPGASVPAAPRPSVGRSRRAA